MQLGVRNGSCPSPCSNRPMLRKVTAGARTASFDFTSVGDGYYCAAWQRDMLASRRRVGNGHEYNVLGPPIRLFPPFPR